MAPRASWKGFLRISLVTCPIALYPATTTSDRISFNRIHRKTGQRVRQLNVDGKTGEKVEAEDIVKGYEIDKNRYVLIEDEELEQIQVEATKVINVTQFVDRAEVDPAYKDAPYYLAPEGAVGEETYRVIRSALQETGTAGIGSIVLSSRERRVLLEPRDVGIMMTTMRSAREVRSAESYFEGIANTPVADELLDMAKMLIQARRQPFQPTEMVDRYEEEVRKLLNAKTKGEVPVFPAVSSPTAIIDLMAALKESLEKDGAPARKPAARGKRPATTAEPATKPAKAGKQAAPPAALPSKGVRGKQAIEPPTAEAKPVRRRKAS